MIRPIIIPMILDLLKFSFNSVNNSNIRRYKIIPKDKLNMKPNNMSVMYLSKSKIIKPPIKVENVNKVRYIHFLFVFSLFNRVVISIPKGILCIPTPNRHNRPDFKSLDDMA